MTPRNPNEDVWTRLDNAMGRLERAARLIGLQKERNDLADLAELDIESPFYGDVPDDPPTELDLVPLDVAPGCWN